MLIYYNSFVDYNLVLGKFPKKIIPEDIYLSKFKNLGSKFSLNDIEFNTFYMTFLLYRGHP